MRAGHKRAAAVLLAAMVCFALTGCGAAWRYDPITDVNDLGGRRVGVNLSWEADYYLTGRKDLELFRYDTTADMILALNYDKVDALALDGIMWQLMAGLSEGLERVEPAFGETGYILYFSAENGGTAEDFNRFFGEFMQTNEYRDLIRREASFDGLNYEGPDIPLTGTGRKLRVAYDPNNFPRAYLEPGESVPTGFDIEALKRYANERDYQLEFLVSAYDGAMAGLQQGTVDIFAGYLSDVYREEVEASGLFTSCSMDSTPMYFVQKTQREISVALDEE